MLTGRNPVNAVVRHYPNRGADSAGLSMMNFFQVWAEGEEFDVDAFATRNLMLPTRIWRRGDPLGGRPSVQSGIAYEIADGRAVPILEQEQLALEFLRKNRNALKALGECPGVTRFILGLHFTMQARPGAFSMEVSTILMSQLQDIGCTLAHFVWLE